MKNKDKFRKLVLAFFISLGLVAIAFREIKDSQLEGDFQVLDTGQIENITTGGYTAGGVTYTYFVDGQKFKRTRSFNGRCENAMIRLLPKLKKRKFQVVFQTGFPENSKILLLKSQYEKYKLVVPENLKEIIYELSVCE